MKVPTLGESISEITVAKWNKKDGDFIKAEDVLCEMESDKATFELNAEKEGILKIVAKEGDVVPIGGVLCEILPAEGASSAKENTNEQSKPVAQEATKSSDTALKTIDVKVPTVGESISEVTIAKWNKKEGDIVKLNELLCELESDKATFELTAETEGKLHIVAAEGAVLAIGALICNITTGANASTVNTSQPKPEPIANEQSTKSNYAQGHTSPAANKILAEKGISAEQVKGSGVDGRITKEDALKAEIKKVETNTNQVAKEISTINTLGNMSARNQDRQKMSSLRKTVSRRLVAVKNETAMLTTFNEVDMKPIMDLRAKYKDSFKEKHQVGLGFMSFFTKACTVALKEFPAVNAFIDGEELVYNNFCDVSIAVSAPKGLVVPVIRNAELLSFDQIEKEIVRLATKARDNKLTIDEMTGGTFTITNGGIFGSMLSTPIINAPQSAILGMHNIVERPVAIAGQVVIRPIMYVALSYDHRIIDGRESVGFLVRVKQLLEDPTRLLLGV
jgi:2-oxoglutarate dehydrogenase E2 component (dihydrolipoamide succinyltransferase)